MTWPASDQGRLVEHFESERSRLSAIAYRMLGSRPEAEDAVQDAWVRASRAGIEGVENVPGWLTSILVRVCLNVLEARAARKEESFGVSVPDAVISEEGAPGPEDQALLADSVGLALSVVIGTLGPAERIAFVLHDLFGFAFADIAPMVGRTPAATRQLASRARRRVRTRTTSPDVDLPTQRKIVDAYFAAARRGEFYELVALLDPNVVLCSDGGATRPEATALIRGAEAVARRALMFAQPEAQVRPALVNGAAGVVIVAAGRAISVMGFTVARGHIAEIDAINDPERLARLDLGNLGHQAR